MFCLPCLQVTTLKGKIALWREKSLYLVQNPFPDGLKVWGSIQAFSCLPVQMAETTTKSLIPLEKGMVLFLIAPFFILTC